MRVSASVRRLWDGPQIPRQTLLLLCGWFLLGGICGTLIASRLGEDGLLAVRSWADLWQAEELRPLETVWSVCRYPLLALVFGASAFGAVLLPLLSGLRGFTLCLSIAALLRAFGGVGLTLSLAAFGIQCLLALPCFFVLAVCPREGGGVRLRPALLCLPVLLLCILAELFLTPMLLQGVLSAV